MTEHINIITASISVSLAERIKTIESDLQEVKESISFMNDKYEEIKKTYVVNVDRLVCLENENKSLQTCVSELRHQINQLEQHSRSCNIEIQGVTESKSENVIKLVRKLGDVVGCPVGEDTIKNCSRIAKVNRTSARPRGIVAQFNSQLFRDKFLASVIQFNRSRPNDKLKNGHIGIVGNNDPIFVMEHLSPTLKALHAATRQKTKELSYKFVWVRNARIYVRKDVGAEQVYIKNVESLAKLR